MTPLSWIANVVVWFITGFIWYKVYRSLLARPQSPSNAPPAHTSDRELRSGAYDLKNRPAGFHVGVTFYKCAQQGLSTRA